ncbi:MAG: hypothetical protein ACK2U0_21035 [Candidatus Promineifilaceae bacterium]|jgi:hypothetical protein
MPNHDAEFWNKARRARDKLVKQYIDHPDVSLIDIGYAPEQSEGSETIALRIHVKESWLQAEPEERVEFPSNQDGIPVVVVPGDYELSSDTLSEDE